MAWSLKDTSGVFFSLSKELICSPYESSPWDSKKSGMPLMKSKISFCTSFMLNDEDTTVKQIPGVSYVSLVSQDTEYPSYAINN